MTDAINNLVAVPMVAHVMTAAEKELVDLIKLTNPGTAGDLTYENIVLSKAVAVTGREDTRNTKVVVSGVPEKGIAEKSKDVFYWRIDLAVLFSHITPSVGLTITESMSTHDLVPAINAKYGTTITTDDIVQTPLDVTTLPGTAIIKAADGNVKYFGQFSIAFNNSDEKLEDLIVNDSLIGFNMPNNDPSKGQASMYSYNLESSESSVAFWEGLELDQPLPQAAEDEFNALYGMPADDIWLFDTSGNSVGYNLTGATTKYVGTNTGATLHTQFGITPNPRFGKVAIIQLGDKCANFGGYFLVGWSATSRK